MRFVLLITLVILLSGCLSASKYKNEGGGGSVTVTETITEEKPDGTIITTETKVESNVSQPENPDKPAIIRIDRPIEGGTEVEIITGGSRDTASAIAAIDSLQPLVFIGAGLIVLGVIIVVWTKGGQLMGGASLGIAGVGLIALSYLLPTFPYVFLIGIVAAILAVIAYILYSLYGWKNRQTAVDENVKLIENIKNDLSPKEKQDIFDRAGGSADLAQSRSTKRLVKKSRKRMKKNAL